MVKRCFFGIALFLALAAAIPDPGRAQFAAAVTRGPYIQSGTPSSMIVKWRTDIPTDSRVRYGVAPQALQSAADDPNLTTEHQITLTGLSPNTRYYYSVGTSTTELSGGDANQFFFTAPAGGSSQPVRIWAFGDSGMATAGQQAVRDAYLAYTGDRRTDVWLMLGDNAYEVASDADYQNTLFNAYPALLKNNVLWPTFGNHEGFSSNSTLQIGAYYDIFSLPTSGQAGGAPSGTEAYYSFDYGNIHFICLNSHDVDRAPAGAMMTWLRNDLAQNTRQWTIAFFHHPTYSKGSHDSDSDLLDPQGNSSMREMRENALPILEQYGVDLVLTGHSHSYERSFLLSGHYGTSDTLTDEMKIDAGDGREFGDGPYRKPQDISADSHAGTVYAVVGTGSAPNSGSFGHPVMVTSFSALGSLVVDISGQRLDAGFLDETGAIRDNFTILKGDVSLRPAAPALQPIADDSPPDQANGVDRDGKYRLSWTYPAPPVEQPCAFQVEEANPLAQAFYDDAEQMLESGSNSKWTGGAEWISVIHPGTGTLGYSLVYTNDLDISFTMRGEVAIPAGSFAELTFDSFEDIEKNFDFAFVEISGGGGPFQTRAQYTGSFSGMRVIDLSAFAGQTVKIRFRFTSDFITAPPQLGWFIDNVRITNGDFTPIAIVSCSSSNYDVAGRPNGMYGYRVVGLFGDCGAGSSVGPYSRVRRITVELGSTTFNPTASFNASPNPAQSNQAITFDGSTSHDNDLEGSDPQIVRYFWSFGDGFSQMTTGPTTSHAYSAQGIYRATLTVTDNDGETAVVEQFLVVIQSPQALAASASGGGFIVVNGGKANFGFNVEKKGAAVTGHLTYHDHGNKLKVYSTNITSLVVIGNRAIFSGACTINKTSGFTFSVEATDNGEPGSTDTFRLRLSNGYEAGGTLGGGNIQVHN